MKELKKNLWDCGPVIVITTNGYVRKDGGLVMGRGCALEAMRRFPAIVYHLGHEIKTHGNHVHYLYKYNGYEIFSFPVKHNWWAKADIKLIERSASELFDKVVLMKIDRIYVPRPGCGFGTLNWEEVKPVLEKIWDDRFIVVHK